MDYPEKNDFVVVKIVQILGYGVFVELLEYNNARGFIHISNVSSSWVKNIRNLVKINQVRVAKVLGVDTAKKQIDLSFAGISPQIEKQKLTEFKQVNREEKLISILAKKEKKDFEVVWREVAEPLINEFGSLYKAFEKIYLGEDLSKFISKKWSSPVKELVEKNIVVSKKSLKAIIELKTLSSTGVNDIKDLLKIIENKKEISIIYSGAGKYVLTVFAPTYKEAEKNLNKILNELEVNAKQNGISFKFNLENEKQKNKKK